MDSKYEEVVNSDYDSEFDSDATSDFIRPPSSRKRLAAWSRKCLYLLAFLLGMFLASVTISTKIKKKKNQLAQLRFG